MPSTERAAERAPSVLLAVRGAIGGALMGLANLVPGISGGTMLLAAGVYPAFIEAVADLTTLRLRARSLVLLGAIVATAGLAVLLLAGPVKGLVQEHRWIMYSLFVGLTLGGVPLVWRMARPASGALFGGGAFGLGAMLWMASGDAGATCSGTSHALVFVSGLAGASAMILPGVSGGYLLLLLRQYETILGSIDQVKRGLLGAEGAGPDLAVAMGALDVIVPFGLGVALGVLAVSNLLRWLLHRFEKATLGALLGLLLGAVIGLWPFQQARAPAPGDVVKCQLVTLENADSYAPDDWPVVRFGPSSAQAAAALALVGLGLAGTLLVDRLGGADPQPG